MDNNGERLGSSEVNKSPQEASFAAYRSEYYDKQGNPKSLSPSRPTISVQQEEEEGPRSPSQREIEIRELFQPLVEALSVEGVREELLKDNPDFTQNYMLPLGRFIDTNVDPTDPNTFQVIVDTILNPQSRFLEAGRRLQLELSDASRRVLFEWILEKIIGIPDSTPDQPYGARLSSFYIVSNKDFLLNLGARIFSREDAVYFAQLAYVRQIAHDLGISLRFGQQYKEFVTQTLKGSGLDFMQNDIGGVNIVLRLYEKITANKVAEKKTWLEEGDIRDIERKVKSAFEGLSPVKKIEKGFRKLTDWERDRALLIGKTLFAGTQRMAMYAALGDLPKNVSFTKRFGSVPYEFIARAVMPLKLIAPRFFDETGPLKFMEMIFKEQELIDKDNKVEIVPLFGLDKRTIIMDSYAAYDLLSHGWRSELLFLGNINLAQPGGEISLLDYLDKKADDITNGAKDSILGALYLGTEKDKDQESQQDKLSEEVTKVVLGQRLYLSVLAKHRYFNADLKTKIWEKIALLKPSTIVSLLPKLIDNIDNKEVWDSLKKKLYIAEEKRVQDDAIKYYNPDLPQQDITLGEEVGNFNAIKQLAGESRDWSPSEFLLILNYMGMVDTLGSSIEGPTGLTAKEKRLLQNIIRTGIEEAGRLARAKMFFNVCIDDAPVVSWKKTGVGRTGGSEEDLLRILLSDQDSYSKAWGAMNALIERPAEKPVEAFAAAVKGIGDIIGRAGAQNIIDPFITAWVKMGSTDKSVLWVPGSMSAHRLGRSPTSEMERHWRESYISMDEQERSHFLQALGVVGAVRDNKKETTDGVTQLDKIRKKTKSSTNYVWISMARIILFLFGPVAAYEFLKVILPAETAKLLQLA